jgi:hypothetical protein
MMDEVQPNAAETGGEFTIFRCGVIHRAQKLVGIDGNRKSHLAGRFAAIGVVCWLPLMIVSVIQGQAMGGSVDVPFLYDWSVHIRFLIVIPLFLLADVITEPQLAKTIRQFQTSNLITEKDLPYFRESIERLARLARSNKAELFFLALVILFAIFGTRKEVGLSSSSWMYLGGSSSGQLSLGGIWFFYFGIPLYQFILLNWLWRYIVWIQFLWRVSRRHLRLSALHPDRSGGLGFLGLAQASFSPLILGFSAMYSSVVAKEIVFDGKELVSFGPEIATLTALFLILFLAPLLVFASQLTSLRVTDLRAHSALSAAAARSFARRWRGDSEEEIEQLLRSAEIDALSNMTVTYDTIKRTRIAPIDWPTVISILTTTLGPMVPLILTLYSPTEILDVIKSVLFG